MNLDFDPQKNYYEILWLEEWADEAEIKKAYRKLAMKYHPDRNKNDKASEEKFKEVNEANEVLSDSTKRQQYDAYRKWWFWAWGFGWFGGAWGVWGVWGFWGAWGVDLWDLLGGMFGWGFGGWAQRQWPVQWDDLIMQMTISFEQSYHGLKKTVTYSRLQQVEGVEEKTCETCGWAWVVSQQARTPFGVMQTQAACPTCGGVGKEFYKDGKKLEDWGLTKKQETLEVVVPEWIKSWSKMRYQWRGNAGRNGWPNWDFYIKILVQRSEVRSREWDDIFADAKISIYDAVLWGTVSVPHPDGTIEIKIPKWLQVGENIRMKWKGFGKSGLLTSKGDLVVIPEITIPKKLSKKEENLWSELRG